MLAVDVLNTNCLFSVRSRMWSVWKLNMGLSLICYSESRFIYFRVENRWSEKGQNVNWFINIRI